MRNLFTNRESFDRIAQKATRIVVRPWFFWLVFGAILAWIPTLWLWDTGPSDLLVDSLSNPLSLILLVLLQNAQSRQENALDRRLDVLEHSLATLLRHVGRDADDPAQREKLFDAAQNLIREARESTREASAGEQSER